MTDERLYNTRNINTYIEYLRIHYPDINIKYVLDYAGITQFELEDEGHWLTQQQIDRYYEILVEKTGNQALARDVGRFAPSSMSAGALPQYIIGFLTPKSAYMALGKLYPYSSRSCKVTTKSLGSSSIEVIAELQPGVVEKPYQCENRIGIFESIAKLFTGSYARISHPQCMYKEGNRCVYVIEWEQSQSFLLKRIRNYVTTFGIFASFILFFILPHAYRLIPLVAFLLTYIATSLLLERRERSEFESTFKNHGDVAGDLLDQINIRYNNVLLIQEIGQYSSSILDISTLLKYIMETLEKRLDFDRGMIMLANPDCTKLTYTVGYGYPKELEDMIKSAEFHLDNPQSRGHFVVSFREQKSFLVNDLEEVKDIFSKRSLDFAKALGVKSFICVPIVYEGQSEGILAVDNIKSKRSLGQSDMNMLMGIAPQIAIDINNARAYQNLKESEKKLKESLNQLQMVMNGTILAISKMVESRDPYTSGHQERVSHIASSIAEKMGLPMETVNSIRIAAALHDIGKINVPAEILSSPRKLTDIEYGMIKLHPEVGYEILKTIDFNLPIAEIVLQHHEMMDGSGYPIGIAGDNILLESRIIAVADVVESMASHRPYRPSLGIEQALAEIESARGTRYDSTVVDTCLDLFRKGEISLK